MASLWRRSRVWPGTAGELTITPRPLVLTRSSLTTLYDGTAHVGAFTLTDVDGKAYAYNAETGQVALEGEDVAGVETTARTNVGSEENVVGLTFAQDNGFFTQLFRSMALGDNETTKSANYEIADEVGAYLMVDMAHIAGLVAAGEQIGRASCRERV